AWARPGRLRKASRSDCRAASCGRAGRSARQSSAAVAISRRSRASPVQSGDDTGAERAFADAGTVINNVAAGLARERAARFLAAEQIQEVLKPRPSSRARS